MSVRSHERLTEILAQVDDDRERRRLLEAWDELDLLAEESPPSSLSERFGAIQDALATLPASRRWPGPRRPWPALAAALALGIAVGLWLPWPRSAAPGPAPDAGFSRAAVLLDPATTAVARLAAMDAILALPRGQASPQSLLLDRLGRDPSVNVRLAAARALAVAPEKVPGRLLIRAMERESSPLVQMALIDLLLAHPVSEGSAILQGIVRDPDIEPVVRDKALWALERIGSPSLT